MFVYVSFFFSFFFKFRGLDRTSQNPYPLLDPPQHSDLIFFSMLLRFSCNTELSKITFHYCYKKYATLKTKNCAYILFFIDNVNDF